MATELLEKALAAHGGLARWSCFATVQATIVTGGQLFGLKGTPQDPTPRRMTVATQREWASVFPYGADDQRTDFTANRIAIQKLDGAVVKERLHPSEHAEGKAVDAPWDALDRAYFNGYALWTYLTTPFHFAMPGFAVEEIEPWHEGDELWRGLRVTYPLNIASHSREQGFLLRPRPSASPARLPCGRLGGLRSGPIRLRYRDRSWNQASHEETCIHER